MFLFPDDGAAFRAEQKLLGVGDARTSGLWRLLQVGILYNENKEMETLSYDMKKTVLDLLNLFIGAARSCCLLHLPR